MASVASVVCSSDVFVVPTLSCAPNAAQRSRKPSVKPIDNDAPALNTSFSSPPDKTTIAALGVPIDRTDDI